MLKMFIREHSKEEKFMGKILIIAEKNSMARDIVSAIGGCSYNKKESYYENNKYIVMSLLGHVMTLYDMEDYDFQIGVFSNLGCSRFSKCMKGFED